MTFERIYDSFGGHFLWIKLQDECLKQNNNLYGKSS